MDSLQQDHECAEKSHREVNHLGQLWLASGRPRMTQSIWQTLIDQLVELYHRHIAMEDTEVFPFAANALASSDREAIGAEMAARRGIGPSESHAFAKSTLAVR
jgi:hemerythrin-like domain-containing protein